MKKILKTTVLLVLLTLILLATVSCEEILKKIPFISLDEATTTPVTTPESTTPPHTHTFTKWKITQNATCTADGQQERTCSCGEKETKKINARGHNEVVDVAVVNTCTTDGLTAGSHCADCGEILVKQEIVKAFGHTEVIDEAIEATCSVEGKTEGKHCSVCNQVLIEQVAIKVDHTYTSTLVEPTATTEGYTEYTCSICKHTHIEVIETINMGVSEYNRHLVGYTGEDNEELVISAVYQKDGEWYRVNSIDNCAFILCDNLRTVVIPDSVISIHYHAFTGCNNLISVELPSSVILIGDGIFIDCENLQTIRIPESVTSIGNEVFLNCTNLRSVDVPNSVMSIGDSAFGSCNSLTNITIPDSVTSIGACAFYLCSSLTSITIPNHVTSIGNVAFGNCTSLISITFEGTVEQWEAISFGENWNYAVPATEVVCSDGTVTLN